MAGHEATVNVLGNGVYALLKHRDQWERLLGDAELLDTWLWRWVAFLIVFVFMLLVVAVCLVLGYLKVRRIRGPQQTIASVKETRTALIPSGRQDGKAITSTNGDARPASTADPSGW